MSPTGPNVFKHAVVVLNTIALTHEYILMNWKMQTHHDKEASLMCARYTKTVITIDANAFEANIHFVDNISKGRKLTVILKYKFC